MHLKYTVSDKDYRRFIWKELLFEHVWNPLILLAYFAFWQVTFLLAQYGMLKRNLPFFILLLLFFIGVMVEFLFRGDRRIHRKVTNYGDLLYFTSIEVFIMEKDGDVKNCIPWKELKRLRENKKWVFLYFTDLRFIPVEKAAIQESMRGELRQLLESKKHIRKVGLRWTVLVLWGLITVFGMYAVGKSAVSYNGKLSWKIEQWKSVRKVSLDSDNIYEIRLEGMMERIGRRIEISPHLSVKDYSVHFQADGTIDTIDMFLYGFDGNYKPHRNYLIWYDREKDKSLYVRVQNLEGIEEDGTVYDLDSDFAILETMMEKIPLEEDVSQWKEKEYGLLYKGNYNWGSDTTGIRLIDKDGAVSLPSREEWEIKGPSLSVYCVGRQEEITPVRYVYKK